MVAQHLASAIVSPGVSGPPLIVSTRGECLNSRRQMIAMTEDHARHPSSSIMPIVLIVPGFGATQTDYVALSYYLASNRLRVIRYDHTNHLGQSDGDILHITLRGMQTDLQSLLDFIRATWPTAPLALLAEDISARVALKVMSHGDSDTRLFLLNPVLDIDAALSRGVRVNADHNDEESPRRNLVTLWGHNVNVERFFDDAIAGAYMDPASSVAEYAGLQNPPVILTSPRFHRACKNAFGSQQHILLARGTSPAIIPLQADISDASYSFGDRHARTFRVVFQLISASLVVSPPPPSTQLREPRTHDIQNQQRLEREHLRIRRHASQSTRNSLWVDHLVQLPRLAHLSSYWALMNDLHRRLLPLAPGMTVLDVGCGLGDMARTILTSQVYRSACRIERSGPPLRYIGMDQSHELLTSARRQIHTFTQELPGTPKITVPMTSLIATQWIQADWTTFFPFTDRSIDRILCHLSPSFSPSPLEYMRETFRALREDGTAVVTCFQPHTDFAMLFTSPSCAADIEASRPHLQTALHHFGRLREAIRHGIMHHFERHELARLLDHAGGDRIQIYTALDNQLLLAVVRKAKSTG